MRNLILIIIIIIFSQNLVSQTFPRDQNLITGEYYINTDPGEGMGIKITDVSPPYGFSELIAIINITDLKLNDRIWIRFKSTNGKWSAPVSLQYIRDPGLPNIDLSSTSLSFSAAENGTLPESQTFTINNNGGGLLTWSISSDSGWVEISPKNGVGYNIISVKMKTTNLKPGFYQAILTINSPGAWNNPQKVYINYKISGLPKIALSIDKLSFSILKNDTSTQIGSIKITNAGGDTLRWSITKKTNWLNLYPAAGTDSGTVNLTINKNQLNKGTYYDTLLITSQNAVNSPQSIPIILKILGDKPMVSTNNISNVSGNSAIVSGTVNPNDLLTAVWFEYGANSSLSSYDSTTKQNIVPKDSLITVIENLSNLSFNTTYYYRIAARNSMGLNKGTISNFTTIVSLPAVTTAPTMGITITNATLNGRLNPNGNPTTAWFEWGTSDNLSTFDSTAKQNIGSGINDINVTADLKNLNPNATYFYRLVASNINGKSVGNILNFTTKNLSSIPKITQLSSIEYSDKGSDFIRKFRLTDTTSPTRAMIYYRMGGANSYDSSNCIINADGNHSFTIPKTKITERGVDYYLKLNWGSFQSTFPESDPINNPASVRVRLPEVSTNINKEKYYLFAVPAEFERDNFFDEIKRNYGDADDTKWRLFRWNSDKYLQLLDSNSFNLKQGDGFWLITCDDKPLTFYNTITTPTNTLYKVTLRPGWNMIGNPFLFNVPITSLIIPQGKLIENKLLEWNPDGYYTLQNNIMAPWKGFFLRNNESQDVEIQIKPVYSSGLFSKITKYYGYGEWKMKLTIGNNFAGLGCLIESKDDWDPNDLSEPPAAPTVQDKNNMEMQDKSQVKIRFPHNDWKQCKGNYLMDYRAIGNYGKSWDVGFERQWSTQYPDKEYDLEIYLEGNIPENNQIVLYDYGSNKEVNINKDSENRSRIRFYEGQKNKNMRISVGESDYLKKDKEERIKDFRLYQNYPNPFNPSTGIGYLVPFSSQVTIKVYNILGQVVDILVDRYHNPGSYSVEWHPNNLPGGIYYLELLSNNFKDTKKMVYLK